MKSFKEYVESLPPPGMDKWIEQNRQSYIDQHGDGYEAYLMSAAWTVYRRIFRDPEVLSQ